jgi:hypothetical protein
MMNKFQIIDSVSSSLDTVNSDLNFRRKVGNIPGTCLTSEDSTNHNRCRSCSYAQTKVQFMDLQKILYAKG